MGLSEHQIEVRLASNGIHHPIFTVKQARATGLWIERACAMLMMETSGGWNEFGSDPGNPVHGGWVTKARYHEMRGYVARGYPSQGVGPCQLTSVGLLDEADKLGGSWLIPHNMTVGFRYLHELQNEHGVQAGFSAYNGSGPAAVAYGERAVVWEEHFRKVLS